MNVVSGRHVCIVSALTAVFLVVHTAIAERRLLGPGDVREGYENTSYRTQSKSLLTRRGKPHDLYALYMNPPLGLPKAAEAEDNPVSGKGIALGRRLFFDRRLSLNNTMSCAMCHVPEMGFAHNEMQIAVGMEGRSGRRNAPTLLNVAYKTRLFVDGRETSLENQVWSPLLSAHEMGNPSVGYVLAKINAIKAYAGLFEEVFGRKATIETVGKALAQYQHSLLSANSRFDRWRYGKDEHALNENEKKGFEVFAGKGLCSACHLIGEKTAIFTDNEWHNTGIGYEASMSRSPKKVRVQLAPGVFADMDDAEIKRLTQKQKPNDVGLYEITQNPDDRWKYVTPTLRNIALTAPYMHDGSLLNLEEVVEFYDRGGIANELLDPLVRPLHLSDEEKSNVVAFLRTLTGANVEALVADAFAAPVGELGTDDPFWANQYFKEQ